MIIITVLSHNRKQKMVHQEKEALLMYIVL